MTVAPHTLHDMHFQMQLCSFMLRDTAFLRLVAQVIKPEYFSDEYLQRVVRIILQFFTQESAAPDRLAFRELDKLVEAKLIKEQTCRIVSSLIDDLYEYELTNREYLLREVGTFVRFCRIEANFPTLADLSRQYRFDEAKQLAKEMFFEQSLVGERGRRYSADASARVSRRAKEEGVRCWTLIPEVDHRIDGLRPGEIGVWQSQKSSAGKTAALVLLARNFMIQRKNVCIYSLEESEDAYEDRLDQCLCGMPKSELGLQFVIERRIRRFLDRGKVWIKKFPDATTRISDLREYTQFLRATENFYPDVILIDYACKLAPETAALRKDIHAWGEEVYTHWRGWMDEEQLVGWTGMQSNRGAMSADVADQQHTGGSLKKTHIADLVLSINRAEKDELEGTTLLRVVKNRNGPAGYSFRIHTDFSIMAFRVFPEDGT